MAILVKREFSKNSKDPIAKYLTKHIIEQKMYKISNILHQKDRFSVNGTP